ncbi:MAG: DUF1653 domain-containing protein [Lachnospira sp.]
MERELVIGGFYRHFKDKLYQVVSVAYHSETKEKMVVYQALYGDFKVYVRPFDMFLSEVDHEKYPAVTQKYRFEQVSLEGRENCLNRGKYNDYTGNNIEECSGTTVDGHYAWENANEALEVRTDSGITLADYLDAKGYKEKLDILNALHSRLNDDMLDVMAEAVDVVLEPGNVESRYQSLKNCLMAHIKYEGTRLRR